MPGNIQNRLKYSWEKTKATRSLGCSVGHRLKRRPITIFERFRPFERGLHGVDKHALVMKFHGAGLAQPRVKIKQLCIARGEPAEVALFDQFFGEVATQFFVVHSLSLFQIRTRSTASSWPIGVHIYLAVCA